MTGGRKRLLIMTAVVWAGSFFALAMGHMLVLVPQEAGRRQAAVQLEEKKRAYAQALEAAKPPAVAGLREEVESLEERIRAFVLKPEELADLTFDVGRLADDRRVKSFMVSCGSSRKGAAVAACERLSANSIEARFSGSFRQFATFLNMLERHRPVVFVDKFKIRRSQNEGDGHKVDMDLVVLSREPS